MDARPEDKAVCALLRLIQARMPRAQAAIYVVRDGRARLWMRTQGFCPAETGAAWRAISAVVAAQLAGAGAAALAASELGLDAPFCALQPLRAAGTGAAAFLVLCGPRSLRGLTPSLFAALADAALIAAPLLADVGWRAPPQADTTPECRASVLPRAAAAQMIEAARAQREAGWSVFLIDLDRFHAVNEALGEAAGDALLAAVGARFETCLGLGDRMARLEGDRFVILAAHRREHAGGFAAGLLAAARAPLPLAGRLVAIQASIGVVAGVQAETPTRAVLKQADAALRRAKAEGRNRFVLHEPGRDAATMDVSRLELDLAEAPARGQMHLVYQNYIDLRDGSVSGAEALMRWRHPTRGELAPAAFIPLAEATGLILPLGAWALRAALEAAQRWPERLTVSVNVSALQFHQPDFVAEVEAALSASGVAPDRLELEITETVLMRDNPETTAQLQALIAKGVRIALDDFGTGYSALAYLGRLPHHRIKLDRSFVQDLGNPATVELVRAIIALAAASGVDVTAEGVERPEQLDMVRALGFTHAQGFVTGRPVEDPIGPASGEQPAIQIPGQEMLKLEQ